MNKRVCGEARVLVKDMQRSLRQVAGNLSQGIVDKIRTEQTRLSESLANDNGDEMRRGLVALECLADEHLASASKSVPREYAESIVVAVLIALALRGFVVEAFKIPSGSMLPTMEIGDHIFVNKLVYGLRVPGTRTKLLDFRKPRRGEVIVFINPCTPHRDFIKRIVAVENDTIEVRCGRVYVNGEQVESKLVDGKTCQHWDLPRGDQWVSQSCARHTETVDSKLQYEVIYSPALSESRPALRDLAFFPSIGETELRCDEGARSPAARAAARGNFVGTSHDETDRCSPALHYVVPKGHVFVMGDYRTNSNDSRRWGVVPIENIKGKALFIFLSFKSGKPTGILWDRIGKFVH